MTYRQSELRQVLMRTRQAIVTIAILSAALNVLLLGGSLYMMMVYDAVLPSHSIPTMVGLLVMVILVYAFQGLFDVLRSRMLADVGAAFDARISPRVQQAATQALMQNPTQTGVARGAMRDVDAIRSFLGSPGPAAFMDLPWILFFLIVLGLLHYWLALTALIGAAIMVCLTLLTQRRSAAPTEEIARRAVERNTLAEERWRHAELLRALGMEGRNLDRWLASNSAHLKAQDSLARTTGALSGVARVFRTLLQSLVLTVGALLVINGEATGGVIFASSVISARALAPIDQVIAQWKAFAAARGSWNRLGNLLDKIPAAPVVQTILPRPERSLAVQELVVTPPGTQRVTAHVPRLELKAGDAVGVIGPSASGKSSFVRALVGAWPAARGAIRLDGATIDQYAPDVFGSYIGYLPQSVELLDGTVGQNISRFTEEHDSAKIVAAAQIAGVHDLILSLPQGYDTPVGSDGLQLSGGQRQRVGLARALYGDPFFVALDEPNSNLDTEGEVALDRAISAVRQRGGIVVIVAHRASALAPVNTIMVMQNGRMVDYGPRDEIIKKLSGAAAPGIARVKGGASAA